MERDWSVEERIPIRRMLTPADLVSLANGFLGMLALLSIVGGHVRAAFTLIVLAVLFDGIDGGLARRGHGSGRLGGKLDTLADLVSFVVVPTYLIWHLYGGRPWLPPVVGLPAGLLDAALVLLACGVYFATGLLRLARFDYLRGGERHDYFVGVTTPGGAVLLASVALLGWEVLPTLLVVLTASLLMTSRIRLPKLRGSLAHAGGVLLLGSAVLGDAARGLGPILLLATFAAYLLLGPGYVRRHEEADEFQPTYY